MGKQLYFYSLFDTGKTFQRADGRRDIDLAPGPRPFPWTAGSRLRWKGRVARFRREKDIDKRRIPLYHNTLWSNTDLMPIYEYECRHCGNKFELLVRTQDERPRCESCGSQEAEKLFSAFGFSGGGSFTSSAGGKGCSSCSTHNCSSCH